jgi:predicted nucleotidyltransferase
MTDDEVSYTDIPLLDAHFFQRAELRLPNSGSKPQVHAAISAYVQQVVAHFGDDVVSITLYGSQARGEAHEESDIDLFVVVRHDTPTLRQTLADLAWRVQFEHDVVISDIIRSVDQLSRMQANRFPYYQSIEREGILLWKSQSELMPAFA